MVTKQEQFSIQLKSTEKLCAPSTLNIPILALKASNLLKILGGEHTFQPPPSTLQFVMEIEHAVVATHPEDGCLIGFVKMTPWVVGPGSVGTMAENEADFTSIHDSTTTPVAIEIGSLVVDTAHQRRGLGSALVAQMVAVSDRTYPGLPKIAVVTSDNTASLHVFKRSHWNIVSREEALFQLGIDVLEGWDPPSTIFVHQEGDTSIN